MLVHPRIGQTVRLHYAARYAGIMPVQDRLGTRCTRIVRTSSLQGRIPKEMRSGSRRMPRPAFFPAFRSYSQSEDGQTNRSTASINGRASESRIPE